MRFSGIVLFSFRFFLLFFLLSAGAFASASVANEKALPICSKSNPVVMVTKGQRFFIVKLESNPTTGYRWFLREHAASIIIPMSQAFLPAKQAVTVGAPGVEVWKFRTEMTAVPEQRLLKFTYARPFEFSAPSAEAETFVCQVTIIPQG